MFGNSGTQIVEVINYFQCSSIKSPFQNSFIGTGPLVVNINQDFASYLYWVRQEKYVIIYVQIGFKVLAESSAGLAKVNPSFLLSIAHLTT